MGIVMTSFSVATVAGVPLGLFLAAHLSWHAPFIGIALLCGLLGVMAVWTLPPLGQHLADQAGRSVLSGIRRVLADVNHLKAFVFSALMMFAGFTVIPYITIYMRSNVGLRVDEIPYIYLCGGVVTLFTARLFGRMADRKGKVETFRLLAIAMTVPMLATTLLGKVPLGWVLLVSSLLFTCMSGRMIPGMAIVTSAADPQLRGTFMTLNAAVQSAAMGLAAFVGGLIIERDAQGLVQNFWMSAVLGSCASLAAVWMAGRLTLHGARATISSAVTAGKT
jgi:predicted MFS family arabinose efflux permease